MQETLQYIVPVEVREADDGPKLRGTILQEGRAAQGGRAEVFAPGSVVWASDGIAVLGEHRGAELARAVPTRDADGSLRIETPATPAILAAYKTRKLFLSVEFHALREVRTAGGVREIQRALVDGAALVKSPEYPNVKAEVRAKSQEGMAVITLGLSKLFHRRRPEVRESLTPTRLSLDWLPQVRA